MFRNKQNFFWSRYKTL